MGVLRSLNFRQLTTPKVVQLNADGQLGVENIKTVITVLTTFLTDLILSIKDGKYSRIIATLFGMLQYGNLIVLAKMAWAEVKNTDLAESNDIVAHFAAKFDLPDDEAEAYIEYAVGLVPRIFEIILDGTSLVHRVIDLFEEAKLRFTPTDGVDTPDISIATRLEASGRLTKAA